MARASIDVDIDSIATLATGLKSLRTEFHDVPKRADGINASIGADTVRDAMNDFADNWDSRRKRLLESIDAVQESAQNAQEAFSDVDLKLMNTILGKD